MTTYEEDGIHIRPRLLVDMFVDMYERQRDLEVKITGKDPITLTGEERAMYIKDMVLALTDELHEALNEVGWKPWASSRHVNEPAFKSELIDALHFLLDLFRVAGMQPQEVYALYVAKNKKNHARHAGDDYDGIKGKCPKCHRAYDDDGVACYPPSQALNGYCAKAPAGEAFYA